MRTLRFVLVLGLLTAFGPSAHAGRLLDMEIVSRDTGRTLQVYSHRGKSYVAGNPGERYAVRLRNRTEARVLAVLSVDGVNAVTGETASPSQSGYVLEPYEAVEVAGWRKSLDDVAQFYFTSLDDSYAARSGRPDHVGVIGVAVFRERVLHRPPVAEPFGRLSPAAPQAREAPSAAANAMRDASEAAASGGGEYRSGRESERLGTGHGDREYAPTRYVDFFRATDTPGQIVAIRYDSHANLVAQGVIPAPPRYPEPRPFPGQFVPDPRG
jgi:plasmid stabilization system protein ParE